MNNEKQLMLSMAFFVLSFILLFYLKGIIFKILFGLSFLSLWYSSWMVYYIVMPKLLEWSIKPPEEGSILWKLKQRNIRRMKKK